MKGLHGWPHPPDCSAVFAVAQTSRGHLSPPRAFSRPWAGPGEAGRRTGGGQAQAGGAAWGGWEAPEQARWGKRGEARAGGRRAGQEASGGPDLGFSWGTPGCGGKRTGWGYAEALSVHFEITQTQLAARPSLGSPCLLPSSTQGSHVLPQSRGPHFDPQTPRPCLPLSQPPSWVTHSTAVLPLLWAVFSQQISELPCPRCPVPVKPHKGWTTCLSHSIYMHRAPQTAWPVFVDGLNDAQGREGEGPCCVALALFLSLSEPQCLNPRNGDGYCARVTTLQGAQRRPAHMGPGEAGRGFLCPGLMLPTRPGVGEASTHSPSRLKTGALCSRSSLMYSRYFPSHVGSPGVVLAGITGSGGGGRREPTGPDLSQGAPPPTVWLVAAV